MTTQLARFFFLVVASGARPPLRFSAEPEVSGPEVALSSRASHVVRTCLRFGELNAAEHAGLRANEAKQPGALVLRSVQPQFQVCSPREAWPEAWLQLRNSIEEGGQQWEEEDDRKAASRGTDKFTRTYIAIHLAYLYALVLACNLCTRTPSRRQ